jgi:hypothetical protein
VGDSTTFGVLLEKKVKGRGMSVHKDLAFLRPGSESKIGKAVCRYRPICQLWGVLVSVGVLGVSFSFSRLPKVPHPFGPTRF